MCVARVVQGSSLHMALPDASVQCVVTSPPYWGLRKYEGEQDSVWGGDAGCEHDFVGELVSSEREVVIHGKTRTTDRFYGDESRRFNGNHQKHYQTNTCLKCGAWRGAYGLEPTPDCGRPFAKLRDDLTEKEREYALTELRRLGLIQ